jgi:hypothetical protein
MPATSHRRSTYVRTRPDSWPTTLDDASPEVRRFFRATRAQQVTTLTALYDTLAVVGRYRASAAQELDAIRDEIEETSKLIYTDFSF